MKPYQHVHRLLLLSSRSSAAILSTLVIVGISARFAPSLKAQENPLPGITVGDYQFSGSLLVGYRLTNTNGLDGRSDLWAAQRYYEAYNLRSGIRLSDVNLYGEQLAGRQGAFDEMYLTASGIGDPFTNAMLRLRKFKGYDLKISYTKADYFLNRNDSLYTGLHKFDMRREMLNASLALPLGDNISLELRYAGSGRSGNMTTTFSPHSEGADAASVGATFNGSIGSYSRDNFYWMTTPRNDWTNNFSGNVKIYLPASATIIVGGGYRTFSQDISYSPTSLTSLNFRPSATSFIPNVLGTTGLNLRNEALLSMAWSEKRTSTTPYFLAEIVTKPFSWLSLTANAQYEKLSGSSTLAGSLEGLIRRTSTSTALRAYRTTQNGTTDQTFERLNASLLATAVLNNEWQVTLLYRYESNKEEATGKYTIAIDTSATTAPTYVKTARDGSKQLVTDFRYTVPGHLLSPQLVFSPMSSLNLRAGVQYYLRSPQSRLLSDGALDSGAAASLSKQTATLSPFFSFYYRPISAIRLRGRLQTTTSHAYLEGTSTETSQYTRLVPDVRTNYNVTAEIVPMEDLSFSLGWDVSKSQSTYTNMVPAVRGDLQLNNQFSSLTASVGYTLNDKTRFLVTGQYREQMFSLPASFTRGAVIFPTPPFGDSLTVLISDNIINRYLDASIITDAIPNLHLMGGISLISATGGSQMTPDLRLTAANPTLDYSKVGGPYSFMAVHGQAQYQIIKNLAVMVDWRWVVLNEQVTTQYIGVNNFAGSLIFLSFEVRL